MDENYSLRARRRLTGGRAIIPTSLPRPSRTFSIPTSEKMNIPIVGAGPQVTKDQNLTKYILKKNFKIKLRDSLLLMTEILVF